MSASQEQQRGREGVRAVSQQSQAQLRFKQSARDFLTNLSKRNVDNLNSLSTCAGVFKEKRVVECIFMIVRELELEPLVGYHAIELLQRFMVKHLTDLLTTPTPQGAAADEPTSYEDAVFDKIKGKFQLIIFSCVQLASKLSLHSHIVYNDTAVQFLHSVGHGVSKQTLLGSELMILKGLEFHLNPPNPLTYVETLLEVLGHNEPSSPVEHLHALCRHVLQFVSLQRTAIYDALLKTTIESVSPSTEQRENFVTVTEDCMLLGVGVIAVAAFILNVKKWQQIVGELSHITAISRKSICDFALVTLTNIVGSSFPVTST
ncbi:hypothetical protein INR49_029461 [Caranx melampygus]|nr:hypothetical protein INR49_029461 [Caranx melampygus]